MLSIKRAVGDHILFARDEQHARLTFEKLSGHQATLTWSCGPATTQLTLIPNQPAALPFGADTIRLLMDETQANRTARFLLDAPRTIRINRQAPA